MLSIESERKHKSSAHFCSQFHLYNIILHVHVHHPFARNIEDVYIPACYCSNVIKYNNSLCLSLITFATRKELLEAILENIQKYL